MTGYDRLVQEVIAKLLLLAAVLLMPLGMAPAAATVHGPAASAATGMGHCPDQAPSKSPKVGFTECTMACAAAIPASGLAQHQPRTIVCEPIRPTTAQRLNSVHPDTTTPPPKRS